MFIKSLSASFPFSNGLGTSLQLSRVKNSVIGNGQTWFLYSKRRLLTQHIREFLQMTPGPSLSQFFRVGPGDETNSEVSSMVWPCCLNSRLSPDAMWKYSSHASLLWGYPTGFTPKHCQKNDYTSSRKKKKNVVLNEWIVFFSTWGVVSLKKIFFFFFFF